MQASLTTLQRLEPNKCEGWCWKTWDDVRKLDGTGGSSGDLFLPVANLIRDYPQIADLVGTSRQR